ncbi:hypothetical protein BC939DRAFT_479389 [Gamsiella multidivaricata]|uniref:uncharacterized protein n=1 Tax=Gamsiella multidivaricata TaxID=101098 RepID=UPI002220CB9D|nr:uncharacterized protein BC939DRAFT_479389 [Gamsiella multidivaricata]KAI7819679.1 hypothetical protein BC939DRAFT_479389 [Gamsiella multidivaricata]
MNSIAKRKGSLDESTFVRQSFLVPADQTLLLGMDYLSYSMRCCCYFRPADRRNRQNGTLGSHTFLNCPFCSLLALLFCAHSQAISETGAVVDPDLLIITSNFSAWALVETLDAKDISFVYSWCYSPALLAYADVKWEGYSLWPIRNNSVHAQTSSSDLFIHKVVWATCPLPL